MTHQTRTGIVRPLASVLAFLAAPLFVPFALLWLWVEPSVTGWIYLAGFILVFAGMLSAPWRRERWRGLIRAGLTLVALAVLLRLAAAGGGETMNFERVGEPNLVAEYANRVVPEADSAVVGGRLILLMTTYITDPDGEFIDAMRRGYRLLADDEGLVPSPWAATYLGMQSSESFDMQSFPLESDTALVFLHGFGGNFTLPCWEVAQAARAASVATFCPSTEWRGRWWRPDAERTLRRTIELARERGYERVFVAGLSNGGIGLSRLAPKLRRDVAGFVFISGVSARAGSVRRPSLVLHGDADTMTETAVARRYAKRSFHAKYEEFSGGHFVLLTRRDEVRSALTAWLAKHTRRRVP